MPSRYHLTIQWCASRLQRRPMWSSWTWLTRQYDGLWRWPRTWCISAHWISKTRSRFWRVPLLKCWCFDRQRCSTLSRCHGRLILVYVCLGFCLMGLFFRFWPWYMWTTISHKLRYTANLGSRLLEVPNLYRMKSCILDLPRSECKVRQSGCRSPWWSLGVQGQSVLLAC